MINQDLQASVVGIPSDVVEHQDYDFFTEQPIANAKVYHFRKILHNWSDDECVNLLRQTRKAMSEASIILIDEVAIKESQLDWHSCYVDLVMGMFFGARERTLDELERIFKRAGLLYDRLHSIWKGQESISWCW